MLVNYVDFNLILKLSNRPRVLTARRTEQLITKLLIFVVWYNVILIYTSYVAPTV